MIDGDGMWSQTFPSKQAAMAYFEQAPAIVMAPSDQSVGGGVREGVRYKAAS